MNWRPMKSAPKNDTWILACTLSSNGHYVVVPAFWGQPAGFPDPDWWGVSFSLLSLDPTQAVREGRDLPELHATLIAITPKCWKPWPEAKKRKSGQ